MGLFLNASFAHMAALPLQKGPDSLLLDPKLFLGDSSKADAAAALNFACLRDPGAALVQPRPRQAHFEKFRGLGAWDGGGKFS